MWFCLRLEIRTYNGRYHTFTSMHAFFYACTDKRHLHGIRIGYIRHGIRLALSENQIHETSNICQPANRYDIRTHHLGLCLLANLWNHTKYVYLADVCRIIFTKCNTRYYCSINIDSYSNLRAREIRSNEY